MAGTQIRVVQMTPYDFSNSGAGQTILVALAKVIDVSRYKEGTLIARLHTGSIGAGGTLSVQVVAVAPTEEDPSRIFAVGGGAVAQIDFASTDIPTDPGFGTLKMQAFSANFGGAVVIAVKGKQPAAAPVTIKATLSAELSLKE